ncbi:MAG: hypothetical protein HYR55_15710 [Acidobacteria bacterium]|nr:hypothetical protein [Acidobacteriota bacterium]MBI3655956.1 hypothetical protein [Acidobacteriota bacterium]
MRTHRVTGQGQQGVALVLTMLLLVLFTVFTLGLYTMLTSEMRASGNSFFANQSFYAAVAGIEKMTSDLSKIYAYKTQPDETDFPIITGAPPVPDSVPGYAFPEYSIGFNGTAVVQNIPSGPYAGLVALVQPYKLLVTARGANTKSETRLRRDFLNNLIPLFQFGIFYDGDLEAHAGPNFNFGGRVHTNRDFYVTAGSTTTFDSRVTVFGEVVRDVRKNGDSAGPPNFNGTVNILDVSLQPQLLLMSGTGEGGSVINGPNIGGTDLTRPYVPSGTANYVNWDRYSVTKFGGNLLNRRTGARALLLPLQVTGNQTIELIKRGKAGDPTILKQGRYYYKPGIRITLSNGSDPYVTDPALGGGGCIFTSVAQANRCRVTVTMNPPSSPADWLQVLPTYLPPGVHFKVEIVANNGTTTDVTQEFLNYGITDNGIADALDRDANSIIRLQRRNNVYSNLITLNPPAPASPFPISFYDMREGEMEDSADTNVELSGIMTMMEINVDNLNKWLGCADPYLVGCTGTTVPNNNGYVVYTSDRRGEKPGAINGDYDYEDTIFRNDRLDPGEDLKGDGVYHQEEKPFPLSVSASTAALTVGGFPTTYRSDFVKNYLLQPNSNVTFRRGLRLVNGKGLDYPLTVASENPIYIWGDYNMGNLTNPKRPASIAGDAITILSNNWLDRNSFNETLTARPASDTTVNAAFIAGSTMSVYASPAPPYNEPHSSGGVHNLMRFLENWSGNPRPTMTYTGSLVNLYTSRQAIGQWKCCNTVYGPPARNWSFDVGFLDPATLPPATPHITIVEIQRFRRDLYQTLP